MSAPSYSQERMQSARRALNVAQPKLIVLERDLRQAQDALARASAAMFEDGHGDLDDLAPLHAEVVKRRARVEAVAAGVGWLEGRRS